MKIGIQNEIPNINKKGKRNQIRMIFVFVLIDLKSLLIIHLTSAETRINKHKTVLTGWFEKIHSILYKLSIPVGFSIQVPLDTE